MGFRLRRQRMEKADVGRGGVAHNQPAWATGGIRGGVRDSIEVKGRGANDGRKERGRNERVR
jgi:hypothetical protein